MSWADVAARAEEIMADLEARERSAIGRLAHVMGDDAALRWLQEPNDALDGRSPESLPPHLLADFIEDMLTGAPN